jgi:hypothetical protein
MDPLDLALDLGLIPRSGRQPANVSIEFERELTPADLALAPSRVQKAPAIKAIRDSHHSLARVLATGSSEGEASLITGYSPSRISILKADPQFQELLEFYRETAIDVVSDLRSRMASMGLDALAELRERLEDSPEDFSPALLKDIVKEMADRTGHAPQRGPATVNNVNVNLGDRMARARERVAQLAEPRTIDHEG